MESTYDPQADALLTGCGRMLYRTRDLQDMTYEDGFELRFPGSEPERFSTQDAAAARFTRRIARRETKPRLFWQGPNPGKAPVEVFAEQLRDRYEADRRETILQANA